MKVRSASRVFLIEREFKGDASPGSTTVVMDESQSAKRKSDAQTKKRQTAETAVSFPTPVQVAGSSSSGSSSANPEQTEPRVVVPPEVPQDARSSIVDMEIGQLTLTSRVKKVQGVSLDADKRELRKLARNNAEHYSEISK